MNRIRYRAVFGLASEKRRTDSRYAKKRPLRKKVSSHTKILPLKAVSVRYGQFLVAWANNALYQWLAGFLTFGSSQRRAFSLSQWHFAACSPVHSDEIVQVLHLFPFYPLPRESAKQRHQPSSYSVLHIQRGACYFRQSVCSFPSPFAASRISCIRRLHGPISQPASMTQRQARTFSMARSKAASLIS